MGDYWQETAALYEQLFSKPKMKENLLSKPPFRYLHDIFTATLGKTGFGEGLYTGEELNSKSFEDKDSKLAWLVKVITLTELIIEEQIDIKPSMVLAGQQPEKTNLWLQKMFTAATSGVDSTPYVQKILGIGGDDEGEPKGGDDGAAEAEAEEAARQLAEAEAAAAQEDAARVEHERAEKKRRAEEKKRRQKQAEEEELQRQQFEAQEQETLLQQQRELEEAEMQAQAEAEQNAMAQQQEALRQQQLMRDGEQHQEEDDDQMPGRDDDDETDMNAKGGALVEEAKRLMAGGEDEAPAPEAENAGPKIKMGRLGKRQKKGAAAPGDGKKNDAYDKTSEQKGADVFKRVQDDKGKLGGFTEKDIHFMKNAIQVLCSSTNPLGRSIEFVTDDLDSMNKEFEFWRKESFSCQLRLKEEQKITEEVIQPLQDQLAEVEEKIREQTAQVNSIKSQIMQNDITVQNLLFSVITTK